VILELVTAENIAREHRRAGDLRAHLGDRVARAPKSQVNFLPLMNKRGRIHDRCCANRPLEEKAETARLVERHVLPQLGAGTIQVPVAATYPLEKVADAYAHFERGGKLGKIVLTLNEAGRLATAGP